MSTIKSELQLAIDRSRSHDEVVRIEIEATDIADVLATLVAMYDGEIDSVTENDGSEDVWGWTDETAEGKQDWRLNITILR
jgi:hypothetical protein